MRRLLAFTSERKIVWIFFLSESFSLKIFQFKFLIELLPHGKQPRDCWEFASEMNGETRNRFLKLEIIKVSRKYTIVTIERPMISTK